MTALPPGPRLPTAVQTAMFWRSPQWFLRSCRRRFGPVFTVRIAPSGTLVYVTDPALVKEVFTGDPATFHAGEGNAILGPILGQRSVLVLDESAHLSLRKLMLPMFHGEAVRAYAEVVREITTEEVARWPLGAPFALHPRTKALTLEVILRAVFGVDDRERLAALREAMPPLTDITDTVALQWLFPWLPDRGPWRRFRQAIEHADALLFEEIARRRTAPDLADRRDILSLLLQARTEDGEPLDDRELRDQLATLLLAGHETTATGLAWAFERILRTPAVHARVVEAARAGDDAYLDAVVQETLRLRPVIVDVVRKLTRPVRVAGFDLPAGVTVAPGIDVVQHDGAVWPEPEAFRPERFLDGAAGPYAWIPFGGGVRRCLGAAFAQMEMRIVLREVFAAARLRAADPRPERPRTRHITQVPHAGSRVVVEARESAPRERGVLRHELAL
jgi:cytochrome P450 family 135